MSRSEQLKELRLRSVMFWLPPGGRDNGVWATTWVMVAELDSADVAPLLTLLHDADIGAYAAKASGRAGRAHAPTNLYVDRDQLPQAADVVMTFLRAKGEPASTTTPRPPRKTRARRTSASARKAVVGAKFLFCAFVIAGATAMAYMEGTHWLAMTAEKAHRLPASHLPGIVNPEP